MFIFNSLWAVKNYSAFAQEVSHWITEKLSEASSQKASTFRMRSKKILMAFKFIWKTDYRILCKAQISELFPIVFTNIIKFYKIMNFHKKWHFQKASLALILFLSFDRIKCWNGRLFKKHTEMPTVRQLTPCIYKLIFHSCFKFWHYSLAPSGNSFQKVLDLIYIISHFMFLYYSAGTPLSFP